LDLPGASPRAQGAARADGRGSQADASAETVPAKAARSRDFESLIDDAGSPEVDAAGDAAVEETSLTEQQPVPQAVAAGGRETDALRAFFGGRKEDVEAAPTDATAGEAEGGPSAGRLAVPTRAPEDGQPDAAEPSARVSRDAVPDGPMAVQSATRAAAPPSPGPADPVPPVNAGAVSPRAERERTTEGAPLAPTPDLTTTTTTVSAPPPTSQPIIAPQGLPQLAVAAAGDPDALSGIGASSNDWRLSAEAVSPGGPAARMAPAPPQAIAAPVGVAIVAVRDRQVELRLDPPELGRVQIQLETTETGLRGMVLTERPETLDLMRRHADMLQRELAAAGYDHVDLGFAQGGRDPERQRASPGAESRAVGVIAQPTGEIPTVARRQATILGALDIRL
jgi:hypothetical protein